MNKVEEALKLRRVIEGEYRRIVLYCKELLELTENMTEEEKADLPETDEQWSARYTKEINKELGFE